MAAGGPGSLQSSDNDGYLSGISVTRRQIYCTQLIGAVPLFAVYIITSKKHLQDNI